MALSAGVGGTCARLETADFMRTDELDFELPAERIAREPCRPRDASRLMVVHRSDGRLEHRVFRDLPEYLTVRDCLIFNTTRVLPARLVTRRKTGGRIEGLFLEESQPGRWRVLLNGSRRLKIGEELEFESGGVRLRLEARTAEGECEVSVFPTEDAVAVLNRVGLPPIPPYISRGPDASRDPARDRADYQTVYADAPGSVAAPTAGLHFTPELLANIAARGIARADVLLHVGLGTFAPIAADDLTGHAMHEEWNCLTAESAATIEACSAGGGRRVAVGTTSVRTLESRAKDSGGLRVGDEKTKIFIYPPYTFKVVDALVTNFHLPRSSLLALVMAFGGIELIRHAYREAIDQGYRFYSFGDAMLIV